MVSTLNQLQNSQRRSSDCAKAGIDLHQPFGTLAIRLRHCRDVERQMVYKLAEVPTVRQKFPTNYPNPNEIMAQYMSRIVPSCTTLDVCLVARLYITFFPLMRPVPNNMGSLPYSEALFRLGVQKATLFNRQGVGVRVENRQSVGNGAGCRGNRARRGSKV